MISDTKNIQFILQTGENESRGYHHLNYWIPEFLKAGVKFAVLVRNDLLLKKLENDFKTLNILIAKSPLDVEEQLLNLKNLKIIFYMSNPWNNIHLLRFNQFEHIFIGSENSDRDAKVSKVLRAYDEIWFNSQASIDKLKPHFDISELTIKLIGKPQLVDLVNNQNKNDDSILLKISDGYFEINKFILLIKDLSEKNYKIDIQISKKILEKNYFNSTLKTHLNEFILFKNYNCRLIDNVEERTLNNYSSIICDLHTYDSNFLATTAKIFVYIEEKDTIHTKYNNKYISFDGLYVISELNNILDYIEKDTMKEKREAFKDYWLNREAIKKESFKNNLITIKKA